MWLPEPAHQLNAKCFPYRLMHTLIRLFSSAQSYCDLCMLSKKQLSGIHGLNCQSNIQHFQKPLCEWMHGKSEPRERWTKPGHTSAAILAGQSNATHQAFIHSTYRKKFSNSWIICLHWGAHSSSDAVRVYTSSLAATGTFTAKQLSAQLLQGNSH